MSDRRIKVILNAMDDRRIIIIGREDGLFRYEEERLFELAPEDEGVDIGWQCCGMSGLFPTAAEAELDAKRAVPWFRDQISN